MKNTHALLAVILITGLVALIVVALVSGIGFSVGRMRQILDGLDPQAGILLGVASLVALLCAWLIAAAIRSAKYSEINCLRATERASLYEAVLESLAPSFGQPPDSLPAPEKAMLLKASAPVLKEYLCLLSMLSQVNAEDEQVRPQVNRLLLAMRRDLGESTFGLDQADWSGWLTNPGSASISEKINGATSAPRTEFVTPAIQFSNRA